MSRTITKIVFEYNELSEKAKEKAREWFREVSRDDDIHEFVYEDAVTIGAILGIEIGTKGKHNRPAIYYTGFWSQGDGACFEGSYAFKADAAAKIREHAPLDEKLHAIADALSALEHGAGYSARVKHSGYYCHSGCMNIDVEFNDEILNPEGSDGKAELPQDKFSAGEKIIIDSLRAFADWIYGQLEKEYEHQNSDENVAENIIANQYEFEEDGTRTRD